ncbi:MAG: protein kinase, partial [Planctomycetaceae bacterium]|nr:protein kinase [Planctomycetaceae bacterium]
MSSHTVISPAHPADPGNSGTRQALLRPMPGERREMAPLAADGRGADVMARLFPRHESEAPQDAPTVAVAGVRLGHFLIEEQIGRGGMGGVFRAVDERLNRVVALKVLAPAYARDSAAAARFRNEAQAAARLDHENISRVYYIGDDEGVPFIAFEFVRGTNVRDFILQKGALSPAEAVNYTLQIAQALRHTQAAGVVHRDIKPSNIIITPSGHAKLVDLGLARQEQIEPARELTVPGTTLGTFDYIAPEQARDPRCVDVRTDIYSLGCTLYHMLTGEPPFPSGTMIQKVVDHHRDAPPDPAERNPLTPPQLSLIVRRMMASNPDERFATPELLIHDLSQVAASLGLRPTHADNAIWARPMFDPQPGFFENNKGWLVTLAALLLIAVVIPRLPDAWLPTSEGLPAASPAPATVTHSGTSTAPSDPEQDSTAGAALRAPAEPETPPAGGMRSGITGIKLPGSTFLDEPRSAAAVNRPEDLPTVPPTSERPRPSQSDGELSVNSIEQDIDQFTSPVPEGRAPPTGNMPETPIVANPFVVMDALTRTEQGFGTLEAACQSAPTDGLIELRFDGRLRSAQPPVRITKRLTIRAQRGLRPVIELQ